MAAANATAEVFLAAFRALPKSQRRAVLAGIAEDQQLREDLLDLATIAERRREPSRLVREYLAEKGR
jgi:hypothetical protein